MGKVTKSSEQNKRNDNKMLFLIVFFKKKSQKFGRIKYFSYLCTRKKQITDMVPVVQLVRASDCGSECRGFESHRAPSRDIAERQCLFLSNKRDIAFAMSLFIL